MPDPDAPDGPSFPVSEVSRLRRLYQRGSHEQAAIHALLDAVPYCHVGYVIDGQPFVTPTLHWRAGERVFWHGSAASRMLEATDGARVCLTVSMMDGYVLARSAFNHSVNYRSVMVFGTARRIEDDEAKRAALRDMVEGLFPGRWAGLRPMTRQELRATSVLWLDIEEATFKHRAAPPGDADEADVPVWAGVLPMATRLEPAQPAPELPQHIALPEALATLLASGRLR